MRPSFRTSALLAVALLAALPAAAAERNDGNTGTRLLRYPDVSASDIAFVYGGDIYRVARGGGVATRLTAHAGQELYPKFSPDGRWIAFSAEYSGTRQVWVMPAAGGEPRQLTWYSDVGPLPVRGGTDYRVLDFTPDGKHVLVRMNRVPWDERGGRPYLVPVAGGTETPLAVPETGGGALSPDGTKYVYTPIDADWRGWKRYRGGRAPDVWIYDFGSSVATDRDPTDDRSTRLTDFRGMDMNPSWVGDSIYFASDRTGTLNLFAMAPAGGDARAITQFSDFDVLWPSGGPDAVVFEQGGWIWRYDAGAAEAQRVPIEVRSDRAATLPHFEKVAAQIESFALSPKGERAVFGARGEVFTVPAKHGEPRNETGTPNAREHSVSWSPDGRWFAYLSDATGEYEIWVRGADGRTPPRRVTSDGSIWKYPPAWSPDSKKLAFADKLVHLRFVDVDSGRVTDVDHSGIEDITDFAWSPDSRWIAYVKTEGSLQPGIWLHSLADGGNTRVSSGLAADTNPVFDPDGRYLYFFSNRDYAGLTFSAYEFNYVYTNPTRIYAATLAADGPALNRPTIDELAPAQPDAKKDEAKPATTSRVDVAGFERRVVALDVPAGAYQGLGANKSGVFFLAGNPQAGPLVLKNFALGGEKVEDVAPGVTGYAMSADGEKLLLRQGNDFAIVEAKPGQDPTKSKLAMDKLELRVDPRAEWPQEYADAWRILRDWFYDEGVHGGMARWDAIRARYAELVPYIATRADLDYILHEVAGEANAGHVYVQSPPDESVTRRPGGFLGADLVADASGYFRIAKIFAGENFDPATRSPLTEPGVTVREGEYLIAVDGVPATTVKNAYALLENKAERVVTLRVNGSPSPDGARDVIVKTIASERSLRYLDWVATRRAMVERLSGGRIGYIHVPNTAIEGNRELAKWFPAVAHYDALLIDDRYNGGGFIPDRMIEVLARTPLNYWKRRGLAPQATPVLSHVGPKAMLVNGLSSSGGDAFPYYFRKLKLGPLIGTRTWGGLIGLSGNPSLADGGAILAATFRFLATDGSWAVENEGVAPDIEVIDRPELIAQGRDPSIEKAVEVLLAQLQENPPKPVLAPAAPSEFK